MTLENLVRVVLVIAIISTALLGMVVKGNENMFAVDETVGSSFQAQIPLPSQMLACDGCSTGGGGPW